jgi:cytochrome P450
MALKERPTLPGFDPLDVTFRTDPFPTWARAQVEAPVFFYPAMDYWVMTRFDDVLAAVSDYKTFSSCAVGVIQPPPDIAPRLPGKFFEHSLVAIDPPDHTVPRKTANSAFTRPRVANLEPQIAELANSLIDEFIADGDCDLMQQYCYQLSLRAITKMLGLSDTDADLERYRQWTEDLFALLTPEAKGREQEGDAPPARTLPEPELRARWTRIAEASEFYQGLIDERRREPGDDMLSALVSAKEGDHAAMSDNDIITHIIELIAAGNDTAANLMGSLILYLSEQPEDFQELKTHPELLPNAVEEGLRRRGSSIGMFRVTTRDVTVSDVEIPQGSMVFLSFQAAGHDQNHFPDPRRVDIHRKNADEHLSFGRGRHFCLGAPLARLEARIGLQTLFERIPTLEVVPDQTLDFAPTMTVSMLRHLQVRWQV